MTFLAMSNASISDDNPNWLYDISSNMDILDISSNMLRGEVPQDIGDKMPQFINFETFCLEENHFVGGIPPQLCRLSYLHFLSLAQNEVSKPIPNCFDGFLSMVDNARHHENLPVVIGLNVLVDTKGTSQIYGNALSYFFSIDLSANMLDGQIPEEFIRLVKLQNLNLSQNNLSGHIPSNISDLKNLESLDLSRNKLSGTIPLGTSNIDFLSYLNLSFNRLSGSIPSSNHLCTMDNESIYHGNDGLRGAPLSKICPGDEPSGTDSDNSSGDKPSEGNLDIHNWFYAGLGPGFTVGFLGFCSILHFKQSWRVSYFRAMDKAMEIFSMTMMIAKLWLKRTFVQRE
ncbi:putative receptor like protein 25 [Syzygium oleosum]|uniref:putative receptor like protein 25 n=1 Tax=Syzygium oleosum TaxID=219896 RepID=UPI0024B91A87|nr:putative receptor like protein 25 [Syzygium oleosum]